jgi:hypothetical protein
MAPINDVVLQCQRTRAADVKLSPVRSITIIALTSVLSVLSVFAIWRTQQALVVFSVLKPATGPGPGPVISGLQSCSSEGRTADCVKRCGYHHATAIPKGCVYDTLSGAFVEPECIDAELSAAWEKAGRGPNGTWQYWLDREGMQPFPAEDIAFYEGEVLWSTWEWHVVHCFFTWQKEWRAFVEGKSVVDVRASGEPHVVHCADFTYHQHDPQEIVTKLVMDKSGPDENFEERKRGVSIEHIH